MIKPKKSLGQHFLTDHNIARKIADSLEVSKLPVLEIGPGTGMLTQYLLKAGHPRFHVIEIDSEAARQLIEMNVIPENQLILADFLKFDLDTLYQDRFNIIGNFPYNISSQIFFKVCRGKDPPKPGGTRKRGTLFVFGTTPQQIRFDLRHIRHTCKISTSITHRTDGLSQLIRGLKLCLVHTTDTNSALRLGQFAFPLTDLAPYDA